jgi:hypothetical protein
MDHERRVQVVLGEAERTDGLLRFVLEAEGFDLVGLASSDEELSRVLRGARPSVVVLDGGISATAALDARKRAEGAALVVVWPEGVSAVLAEERVEPSMAIEDLGNAVRRAVDRLPSREEPVRVPEAADPDPPAFVPTPSEEAIEGPSPRRRGGRPAQILVGAVTWLLVITALTAIATAVPNALDLFSGRGRERPSVAPPPADRPADEDSAPSAPTDQGQPARCDDATRGNGEEGADEQGNADPVRAQGCPEDRGNNQGGNAAGGGRPGDPGSQGNGGNPSGGTPGGAGNAGDATETDGDGEEKPGGGAGNGEAQGGGNGEEHAGGGEGRDQEHGRAGERGRADEAG